MQLLETEQVGRRLLAILNTLLLAHYPAIDRHELGTRCGVGGSWWETRKDGSLVNFLLLTQALRAAEIPTIALEVGDHAQLTDLGLLGYALLTSPNGEHAASITCHALNEANYFIRARLELGDSHGIVSFYVVPEALAWEQTLLELVLVSAWRYIQGILPQGRSASPSYVALCCRQPSYHERYEQLLDCPVLFGEPENRIAIPLSWLYQPIPTGNEQLLADCSRHVQQILGEGYHGASIIPRVKRLLLEKPQQCAFELDKTAAQMHIHPRSLRRYLAQAGISFRRVCLEVRMELARQYLCNTGMTLKEIAYQLNYTHSGNFFRAFSDYYGTSPAAMRRQHQAALATDEADDPA